jgi:hypothetical protein
MGQIRDNVKVIGPSHPSFGLEQAWYTFGVFARDGSIRRFMLVEAENCYAVQMLESLTEQDGSVSATCGLVMAAGRAPQVRSTAVEKITYTDFMLDMVAADRWLDSPFLIELFQKSLSDVDRMFASHKLDDAIRHHACRRDAPASVSPESLAQTHEEKSTRDEREFEQLHAGLIGLGFQKRDVQSYVASVRERAEPIQMLLVEGISKLNRGLS